MMDIYEEKQIQELPLSVPLFRKKVESFLKTNGLRLEKVNLYMAIQDADENILAGGGLDGDTIKCIAVSEKARSGGLAVPLISRLISVAAQQGHTNVKVFTKPENTAIFESLGFTVLGRAPKAVLMENGRGLAAYLSGFPVKPGMTDGVIIMNANPFTIGHKYLIEKAAGQVDHLFVIVVKEDVSRFPYADRLAMTKAACADFSNVTVCEGSDYQISAATFPTYFLKELSDASETQMRLDLDIFAKHIAPALGATVRFVGSEPQDALTARYNAIMKEVLPAAGVQVVELPRLCHSEQGEESPVSASAVRKGLDGFDGGFWHLLPETSLPYVLAEAAVTALRQELDTTPKPGLVDLEGCGSHADMDYALMLRSIEALRPWFVRIAAHDGDLVSLGLEAEAAMLAATNNVNTHKGALFCLGLVLSATGKEGIPVRARIVEIALCIPETGRSKERGSVKGALAMAREGYKELFDKWLPELRTNGPLPTLMLIMATLDDTNILHRGGSEALAYVKARATEIYENGRIGIENEIREFGRELKDRNLSPGGAADMLALTMLAAKIEK
ncbi:MAG: [citrate (pro-3S)-lyase] ligase [Bacteroidales bacterium]|nr:[citrate (pro-3S)-lyase] ligase [Bacteroidales bacterium]